MNEIIHGTSGNDSLYDYGDNYNDYSDYSIVNAGGGKDYIYIGYHTNVSIYGGADNDTIDHWRYAVNSTCGAVHLFKSEDSDLRIFNNEPDVAKVSLSVNRF